jgi:hypothetical protein
MLSLRIRWAACVAASLLATGCCGSLRCGGPACGDGCGKGCSYAGMKYETCCETCGGGFCSSCSKCGSGGCSCGEHVTCGEGCGADCNGSCAKCACKGCGTCGCGKQTPCWLLNCFATCAGCGERHWNEWYNDPPRCAEPCDCYGNWVGPGHGGYYRAPYLNDPYLLGKKPSAEPLELAEDNAAESESDSQDASSASLQQSEMAVNSAATADYDDSQLAEGLN